MDIEDIKKQIVEALLPLNPEKIILFGSYAYGEPDENSDLDIMIIEQDYTNRYDEINRAKELLKDILLEKKDFYELRGLDKYCLV